MSLAQRKKDQKRKEIADAIEQVNSAKDLSRKERRKAVKALQKQASARVQHY